jgi:UDP:flavonoid glycosyltransferase YjiC (YdhE family)
LNSPKISAFITHCGGNSVLESGYYGTPIIGFPISVDQPGYCQRAENLGIGYHVAKGTPIEEVKDLLVDLLGNENHKIKKQSKRIMKMFEFLEERSNKNLSYWV